MSNLLFSPEGGDGSNNGGGGQTILGDQGQQGGQQQQQQPAAWDFRSALDDTGAFKQGWHESLPDDLKPYSGSLAKYPNAAELLRGLGNAQKLIGQRPQELKPPGPDATPEQKAAWFKTLGVPEKPEEYGLKKPDNLPEGATWSDEDAAAFAAKAHELGLTPQQVQAIAAFDLERNAKYAQKGKGDFEAFINQKRDALKKTWGDKYESNSERVKELLMLTGRNPESPTFTSDPEIVELIYELSKLRKEDDFIGSDKIGAGMSRSDQAEDMARNKLNPWHNALWGREGPERQRQAQELRARLLGVKADLDYRP